jgi:hypothetical protein
MRCTVHCIGAILQSETQVSRETAGSPVSRREDRSTRCLADRPVTHTLTQQDAEAMALVEEISAVVLDAGEPLSFRSLSATAQAAAADSCAALEQFAHDHGEQVSALYVTVERAPPLASGPSDPRSRVIRLRTEVTPVSDDAVLSRQVYAVYRKQQPDAGDCERLATACWSQERQARRDVFAQVAKHAPMTRALKALYASGISCAEATARTEFGDEQGEETVSAFDGIKISNKSTGFFKTSSSSKPAASSSSSSSSSFFKSSAVTASKPKNTTTTRSAAKTDPEVKKVSAESMSNVLSIDSSDEDGSDKEDADAPVFVKKTSAKSARSSRVISDDDEDMEDAEEVVAPPSKKRDDNNSRSSTKRKLQKESPSPRQSSESEDKSPSKKSRAAVEEDPDKPIEVATTRRVLVTKSRITPEGYMVTEKAYEEKQLTPEEVESERQAALKKQRLAAERAKASKNSGGGNGEKAGGPRKQKDLRSFFTKK